MVKKMIKFFRLIRLNYYEYCRRQNKEEYEWYSYIADDEKLSKIELQKAIDRANYALKNIDECSAKIQNLEDKIYGKCF